MNSLYCDIISLLILIIGLIWMNNYYINFRKFIYAILIIIIIYLRIILQNL